MILSSTIFLRNRNLNDYKRNEKKFLSMAILFLFRLRDLVYYKKYA